MSHKRTREDTPLVEEMRRNAPNLTAPGLDRQQETWAELERVEGRRGETWDIYRQGGWLRGCEVQHFRLMSVCQEGEKNLFGSQP